MPFFSSHFNFSAAQRRVKLGEPDIQYGWAREHSGQGQGRNIPIGQRKQQGRPRNGKHPRMASTQIRWDLLSSSSRSPTGSALHPRLTPRRARPSRLAPPPVALPHPPLALRGATCQKRKAKGSSCTPPSHRIASHPHPPTHRGLLLLLSTKNHGPPRPKLVTEADPPGRGAQLGPRGRPARSTPP